MERKEPSRTNPNAMESKKPLTQNESEEPETMEPEVSTTFKPLDHEIVKVQLPPFSQRMKKKQDDERQYYRFMELLKQLHINIPFTEAIKQMPKYAKFVKDMVSKKRSTGKFAMVALMKKSNTIIPPKMRDPGSFTIPCSIEGIYIDQALCDLGANINLIMWGQLYAHDGDSLACGQDKFILPADFIILDYEADKDMPIILGRPFLSTGRVQIDVHKGEITMSINEEKLRFNIIKAMKYLEDENLSESDNEHSCNEEPE
ncbi:uncharacterized protein LOC120067377 [Benincasa hispida]|uniref:uncharacterized protein LOC120067377 n=1 Tax=Benincasa hispida TaxID=102211 RepID=UPI001900CFB4|nr:uncharacterized protein LOC120067377 [Benincasa hispida]